MTKNTLILSFIIFCSFPISTYSEIIPKSENMLPYPSFIERKPGVATLIDTSVPGNSVNLTIEAGKNTTLITRMFFERISELSQNYPVSETVGKSGLPVVFMFDYSYPEVLGPDAYKNYAEQGYRLTISPDGIFCRAMSSAGLVNGMASLIQLLYSDGRAVLAESCEIIDRPVFRDRYVSEYFFPNESFFDWMMKNKLNGFASSYRALKWERLGENDLAGLRRVGEYIRTNGTLKYMVQLHLGGRGGKILDAGNRHDRSVLLENIKKILEISSASHIMIAYDDIVPVLQPMEKAMFDSPAEAHISIVEEVYEVVKSLKPNVVVSFCTPYYRGLQHHSWRNLKINNEGKKYLRAVKEKLRAEIPIVWTGPLTESKKITIKDVEVYKSLIGADKELFYWDNTWHYYQPLRSFHSDYFDGFENYTYNAGALLFINAMTPIGKFFASTASNYYWNPDAFNPVTTRKAAVGQYMGYDAIDISEEFFSIRGAGTWDSFIQKGKLGEAYNIMERLRRVSASKEIPEYCLSYIKNAMN